MGYRWREFQHCSDISETAYGQLSTEPIIAQTSIELSREYFRRWLAVYKDIYGTYEVIARILPQRKWSTIGLHLKNETKALEACAGEYALVAKRSGSRWYLGGMTAEAKEGRHFDIVLDFLEPGRTYTLTGFVDGINADRQAMDYRKVTRTVRRGDTLSIDMVRNGGYVAVIE